MQVHTFGRKSWKSSQHPRIFEKSVCLSITPDLLSSCPYTLWSLWFISIVAVTCVSHIRYYSHTLIHENGTCRWCICFEKAHKISESGENEGMEWRSGAWWVWGPIGGLCRANLWLPFLNGWVLKNQRDYCIVLNSPVGHDTADIDLDTAREEVTFTLDCSIHSTLLCWWTAMGL